MWTLSPLGGATTHAATCLLPLELHTSSSLAPSVGLSLGPCVSDLGAILTFPGGGEAGQQPSPTQLS